MRQLRSLTIAANVVFTALAASAAVLFLIPLFEQAEPVNYILAGVFWLLFVGELTAFKAWTVQRVKYEQKNHISHKKKLPPGLFTFRSNAQAAIADGMLLVSVLTVIIITIFPIGSDGWMLLSIVSVYLSLNLHCVLNSRNYRYYKCYIKVICKGVRKHE